VQFVEVRGQTTFRTPQGELQTVTFDDRDLTDAGEKLRLRAALEWIADRSIADKIVRGHEKVPTGVHTRRPQMRGEGQRVDPTSVGLVSIDDERSARCGRATRTRSSAGPLIVLLRNRSAFGFMRGNGFGNETRRNGRDGVEYGVMAWTVEKS
jgi:hypothetical protein